MVEILVHRGIALVQRLREPLAHRVVRRDAVRDRVGAREQDIAFVDHSHLAALPAGSFDGQDLFPDRRWKVDEHKMTLVIQVVVAAFIDYPDEIVPCCARVRD
jgi:hypothetical protein